ncbi:glycosyltransferase family 47 protein [Atractiella rhizophila]|nr:glycosyltransferase family 47 protein [Atractiella rhizophila]
MFYFLNRPPQTFPPLPELQDQWHTWPADLRYPLCIPKIYLYELPEHLLLPSASISKCRWSPYSSSQYLLSILHNNAHISSLYLTTDPTTATHFLIPLDPSCYLFNCWDSSPGWDQELRCAVDEEYLGPALRWIVHDQPWWNRTGGRDHIFFHQMDHRDHYYSEELRRLMQNALYFTTVGDLRGVKEVWGYRRHRDITIPSITYLLHSYFINPKDYLDDEGRPFVTPFSSSPSLVKGKQETEIYEPTLRTGKVGNRRKLAIFRGTGASNSSTSYSLGIRSLFFNSTSPTGEHLHSGFASFPDFDVAHGSTNEEYARALSRAKYGLTPPGWTLDTTRIWEYLAFGVVPVLIGSEGIVLPFEDDIDWEGMTVKISRREAHLTPQILRAIPKEVYEKKRRLVWSMGRQAVIEPSKGLVWHYIARSLCRFSETSLPSVEERTLISIP